jgi:hypothetical protein
LTAAIIRTQLFVAVRVNCVRAACVITNNTWRIDRQPVGAPASSYPRGESGPGAWGPSFRFGCQILCWFGVVCFHVVGNLYLVSAKSSGATAMGEFIAHAFEYKWCLCIKEGSKQDVRALGAATNEVVGVGWEEDDCSKIKSGK